jgi:hypothetical protein
MNPAGGIGLMESRQYAFPHSDGRNALCCTARLLALLAL